MTYLDDLMAKTDAELMALAESEPTPYVTAHHDELVNWVYNERVDHIAELDFDWTIYGKSIPFIGWYWRDADFVQKRIAVGHCGAFIGVIENNKWGYPDRLMTLVEVDRFIELLDAALAAEDSPDISVACKVIWDWFQTLPDLA